MKTKFDYVITAIVILTASVFGYFTAIAYDPSYWLLAIIVGTILGFLSAKAYLYQLYRMNNKGYSKISIWFLGTFTAMICGVICTTLLHGMMLLFTKNMEKPLNNEIEGIAGLIIIIGEIVGLGVGFVVGGICSQFFLMLIKEKNEKL